MSFRLSLMLLLGWTALALPAQNIMPATDERTNHFLSDSVTTEDVPEGIYAWTVDRRFGAVRPAPYDTVPHLFPNEALTDGLLGTYNFTGNVGAPRLSRLFTEQGTNSFSTGQFVFATPFSFFLRQPDELLFTNTKSPFTNLTYHECGNKQYGEDRLRALFSTNVNRLTGLGFRIDYVYGRGYYDAQSTALFSATLFGSHIGERYQLHAFYTANHMKVRENGGIETDDYVNNPESFPTAYSTEDMPTNLSKTFNRMNLGTFYLTHRYNLGFTRYTDPEGNTVRLSQDKGAARLASLADSLQADTLNAAEADSVQLTPHFVPVTSFIHTLRVEHNQRRFISNESDGGQGFFADFYLPADSANDRTRYLHLENLFAIEVNEGFNRWMKTGMRLFAKHQFYRFTLPTAPATGSAASGLKTYTDHYVSLGAQLIKRQGRTLHYDLLGEVRTNGSDWGEFNLEANADVNLPLWRDTLRVELDGQLRNEQPNFYLRHYHARNAWWDADLDNQLTTRLGGTLRYRSTSLSLHVQHVRNLAYLAEALTPYTSADNIERFTHAVSVSQHSSGVQLVEATLRQDFRLGPLCWENALTYQATSHKDVLPLPAFNAWTNLYLKFRIARVLATELGADLRYFTKYYAPAYSPIVGQYAVQDATHRVEIGNYPVVNAYVNFHLKRTRFYVMATHVNHSSGSGRPFLVPHYPLNRLVVRFGVSWNFVN